jgi:hypothetical protein
MRRGLSLSVFQRRRVRIRIQRVRKQHLPQRRASRGHLPGNKTNNITRNAVVAADKGGKLLHDQPIIIWNQLGGTFFEYAKPLSYADKTYSPPFSRNTEFDTNPLFVNETDFDFHLSEKSPFVGAGTPLADTEWGTMEGAVDLGAFGIRLRQDAPVARMAEAVS